MSRRVQTGEKTMISNPSKIKYRPRRLARGVLLACLGTLALTAGGGALSAQAIAGPLTDVKAVWGDTHLPPGGEGQFTVQARNIGDADLTPGFAITDELPEGVTATKITWPNTVFDLCENQVPGGWPTCEAAFGIPPTCTGVGTETVTCELSAIDFEFFAPGKPWGQAWDFPGPGPSGYLPPLFIDVAIDQGASGVGTNTASVSGGDAPPASDVDPVPFDATPSSFGLAPGSFEADVFDDAYPDDVTSRQAGDHPFEQRVNFDITAKSRISQADGSRETPSNALVRTVEVTLPRGMVGNPEAMPKCDPTVFAQGGAVGNATACPSNTQVGYLNIALLNGGGNNGRGPNWANTNAIAQRVALYNLEPPKGTPVDLAFTAGGLVQGHIYATLDPAQSYAIKSVSPNISSFLNVRGTTVTIWGVPGDPAHDKLRFYTELPAGRNRAGGALHGADPPLLYQPDGLRLRQRRPQDSGRLLLRARRLHPHRGVLRPAQRQRL